MFYSRQAIATSFHGPTDTRGARVKATCDAGTIYVGWDYALGITENHAAAAKALATKLGWTGAFVVGSVKGGGHVFVLASADTTAFVR